jgi:hypothetical protein
MVGCRAVPEIEKLARMPTNGVSLEADQQAFGTGIFLPENTSRDTSWPQRHRHPIPYHPYIAFRDLVPRLCFPRLQPFASGISPSARDMFINDGATGLATDPPRTSALYGVPVRSTAMRTVISRSHKPRSARPWLCPAVGIPLNARSSPVIASFSNALITPRTPKLLETAACTCEDRPEIRDAARRCSCSR